MIYTECPKKRTFRTKTASLTGARAALEAASVLKVRFFWDTLYIMSMRGSVCLHGTKNDHFLELPPSASFSPLLPLQPLSIPLNPPIRAPCEAQEIPKSSRRSFGTPMRHQKSSEIYSCPKCVLKLPLVKI